MESKTIGAFIAALRKANGLTQQELADKLNVSNKAVSRWERDECAPDITLIPPLAEILGVTCDELLKGERIFTEERQERAEPKVEKRVKAIITRSLTNFKMLMWISIALSLGGVICMFGISYGAYRPKIGYVVMCVFAVAAFILAAIAVSKLKGKRDNDLFENADAALIDGFNKVLGTFSSVAFFIPIAILIIFIPYVFPYSNIVNSVITFGSYLKLFGGITPALVLIFLALRGRICSWITEQPYKKAVREKIKSLRLMNILQLTIMCIACIIIIIFFIIDLDISGWLAAIYFAVGCGVISLISIIIFTAFILVYKADRKKLVLPGLRNILLIIPLIAFVFSYNSDIYDGQEHISWDGGSFTLAIGLALFILMIFQIIKEFSDSAPSPENKEVAN